MKALSIRAPWWWFILYGGKDIENRDRNSPAATQRVKGAVWIHVGKWWQAPKVFDDVCAAQDMQARMPGAWPPLQDWRALERSCGCIVGSVEIVEYTGSHGSPWFTGQTGLILRNPIPLATAVPFKGQLGFFDVPARLIGDAA